MAITTQEILDAARSVGQLIAKHDASKKVEAAIKSLEADTIAQRALNDYQRHAQQVAEKEAAGQPIEVQDKHKLQTLQQEVMTNLVLQQFQLAQMDYLDLMRKVDETINSEQPINQAPPTAAAESPIVNPDLTI